MSTAQEHTINNFLDDLASKAPTPGGGGAAALMGAQAAALVSMVCNLTIGKANYASVADEMQSVLQQAETLRTQLTAMMQDDITVFNGVMAAYGMPKETETEKAQRSAQIQTALKAATEVPLSCAKASAEVLKLSQRVAEHGNTNVISDAGVAAMAAYAALKSAALNVYVNAGAIKDLSFAEARLQELQQILDGAESLTTDVYALVKGKL